jgi:sirohydrochlorin ferrochelatase
MTASNGMVTGIVLVDHGSKKSAANDMLLDVAALFRRVSGQRIVEAAHMELADPSIGQAFDACVAQGANMVVVHPYFLSPGRHSTTDIPRMVAEAAARHPHVRYHVTQPLGLDEKIAQLIIERIDHCVNSNFNCPACANTGCCDARSAIAAPAQAYPE